jgi:hypothetical protein
MPNSGAAVSGGRPTTTIIAAKGLQNSMGAYLITSA